jgi:hypothetical protein
MSSTNRVGRDYAACDQRGRRRVVHRTAGKGPVLLSSTAWPVAGDVETRHAGVTERFTVLAPICSGRGSPTSPAATTPGAHANSCAT